MPDTRFYRHITNINLFNDEGKMGNITRLHENHNDIEEWVSTSNGGMTVFITVLVLSGSYYAKTSKEKEIIIWFAEHDQGIIGKGTVSFDISDIPWDLDTLEIEKAFISKVINGALDKVGWERLSYNPNIEILNKYLYKFQELINKFESKYINKLNRDNQKVNVEKILECYQMCKVHNILLHEYGCIICNDL